MSRDTPVVSIVIPTYNRATFLPASLQSALGQSFEDWEAVVDDDGSTDQTQEILAGLKDPRIRGFRHPSNRGPAAARNTAIRESRGRYIGLLDSDDTWEPQKLELQVRQLEHSALQAGNDAIALMQCTACYPAPEESLNLRALVTLRERFHGPVGFSDHSRDPVLGPVVSVALGASLVEKHFTLDRSLPGPDHPFSVEPDELRAMVRRIREAERCLGSGVKQCLPVEEELRKFARRSVFAIRDIAAGELFSSENIAVLRNGTMSPGLHPREFPGLLGRPAPRAFRVDTPITLEEDGPREA